MTNLQQIFNKFIELNTDKLVVVLTYTKFTPYLIKKYDLSTQNDVLNISTNPEYFINNMEDNWYQLNYLNNLIVFNDLYNTIIFDFKNNKEIFRTKITKNDEVIEKIIEFFDLNP